MPFVLRTGKFSPFDAVKLPLLPTVEIPSFHVSFLLCSNFEIRKVWYFLVLNGKIWKLLFGCN